MSDQTKSNVQALGAGLLGFVAVMTVGGGALMFHSSQQAKSETRPVAAGAPIDLGSSMPRPMVPSAVVQSERRAESPAPLIGEEKEAGSISVAASPATAAAKPEPGPVGSSAVTDSALKIKPHLYQIGSTSAKAVVVNTITDKSAAETAAKKPLPVPKLAPAGTNALASVHYGVTNRSELMGRAAGPVYNVKGAGKVENTAAAGKMAEVDVKSRIANIRKQLESANLPPIQRAELMKNLDTANASVENNGKSAQ